MANSTFMVRTTLCFYEFKLRLVSKFVAQTDETTQAFGLGFYVSKVWTKTMNLWRPAVYLFTLFIHFCVFSIFFLFYSLFVLPKFLGNSVMFGRVTKHCINSEMSLNKLRSVPSKIECNKRYSKMTAYHYILNI